MSYQGATAIREIAEEIAQEINDAGYSVTVEQISSMLCESDVVPGDGYDVWIEWSDRKPGDLEEWPHLVYCSEVKVPGSAVQKDYRPIV